MIQENVNLPHATDKDYEKAFEGLKFPVAIHQILRRAADTGGIDSEVQDMLHKLPRDQYASVDELKGDLRAVYAAEGYTADVIPV
ncbi:MAG TPA: hypothetical protein VMR52_02505 [Dehalococcoidia bacterium]|nr:hypothetical protein [Dehalococcoidia bacterium]